MASTVDPVVVVARLVAREGKEEEVRSVLGGLLRPTRAEPGCIRYDLHVSRTDPRVFCFLEAWTTDEALDQHLDSEHLRSARERFDELLEEPPVIERFRRIG